MSFAQFEREVTSERIRDKIAASKRKGLWVGGIAPLGYATNDRKIVVVEEEAERVRTIFRRYLELGSLHRLMADLARAGDRHEGAISQEAAAQASISRECEVAHTSLPIPFSRIWLIDLAPGGRNGTGTRIRI